MDRNCRRASENCYHINMAPPEISVLQESIRIVGTGIIALGGAYGGFILAEKGRKRDLYYKERYSSFKQISGSMFELMKVLTPINYYYWNIVKGEKKISDPDFARSYNEIFDPFFKVLDKVLVDQREVIIFERNIRALHKYICKNCLELATTGSAYLELAAKAIVGEDQNRFVEATQYNALLTRGIMTALTSLIDDAYKSLGLPNYTPYFYDFPDAEAQKTVWRKIFRT